MYLASKGTSEWCSALRRRGWSLEEARVEELTAVVARAAAVTATGAAWVTVRVAA